MKQQQPNLTIANEREAFDGAEVVADGDEIAEDAEIDATVEEVSDALHDEWLARV